RVLPVLRGPVRLPRPAPGDLGGGAPPRDPRPALVVSASRRGAEAAGEVDGRAARRGAHGSYGSAGLNWAFRPSTSASASSVLRIRRTGETRSGMIDSAPPTAPTQMAACRPTCA